jgi:hypothetical protein
MHAGTTYEERLRAQHKKLHPATSWASLDAKPQQDPDAVPDELELQRFEQNFTEAQDRRYVCQAACGVLHCCVCTSQCALNPAISGDTLQRTLAQIPN